MQHPSKARDEREHLEASKLRQRCRAAVCGDRQRQLSARESRLCRSERQFGQKVKKTWMNRGLATMGRLQTPTSCSYDVMQQQRTKAAAECTRMLSERDCILKWIISLAQVETQTTEVFKTERINRAAANDIALKAQWMEVEMMWGPVQLQQSSYSVSLHCSLAGLCK